MIRSLSHSSFCPTLTEQVGRVSGRSLSLNLWDRTILVCNSKSVKFKRNSPRIAEWKLAEFFGTEKRLGKTVRGKDTHTGFDSEGGEQQKDRTVAEVWIQSQHRQLMRAHHQTAHA